MSPTLATMMAVLACAAPGFAHAQAFDVAAGIVGPVTEKALCLAGNQRLETVMQPGVPGVAPPEARMAARLKFDKAFEQLGDQQYDACLPFLDEAFELLGLPASYVKAAAANR